jgi:hypothetical protein
MTTLEETACNKRVHKQAIHESTCARHRFSIFTHKHRYIVGLDTHSDTVHTHAQVLAASSWTVKPETQEFVDPSKMQLSFFDVVALLAGTKAWCRSMP